MVFETLGFLSGITSFRPSECVFNLYAPAFACKKCHSYTSDSQRLTRECEKIFKKSRIKVWSVSQKAVLLHPLSIRKGTRTE